MNVWELLGILAMPITYGFVGWLTNTAALHMTLYPLEFKGIRPYLGWQGIVPRRARALAITAVKMLMKHVVRMEDFFARIKSSQLERMYAPILDERIPGIVESELRAAGLTVSETELHAIAEEARRTAGESLEVLAKRLEAGGKGTFNFREVVVNGLSGKNTKHLVQMFENVGSKEFAFIRRSGWIFGGLLGLVQVGLWFLFPHWWTLPIQGAFVGGITNMIALTMIFRPLYERRILGIRFHGLFLKRQAEVSEEYGRMFAERVLAPSVIMEHALHRPMARRVLASVDNAIEASAGEGESHQRETAAAVDRLVAQFAESSTVMERLMGRAMNVRKLIGGRMKDMPPEEFEPVLRNAFREDESLLVMLGAAFGAVVGLIQGLFMLGVS